MSEPRIPTVAVIAESVPKCDGGNHVAAVLSVPMKVTVAPSPTAKRPADWTRLPRYLYSALAWPAAARTATLSLVGGAERTAPYASRLGRASSGSQLDPVPPVKLTHDPVGSRHSASRIRRGLSRGRWRARRGSGPPSPSHRGPGADPTPLPP